MKTNLNEIRHFGDTTDFNANEFTFIPGKVVGFYAYQNSNKEEFNTLGLKYKSIVLPNAVTDFVVT
jgi:hypothetical protein